MTQLIRFDTNALNRVLVGFDRLFDDIEHRFANQIQSNYPPHNILKTGEDTYEIQIAVSGFSKEEISVEVDHSHLIIKGESLREDDDSVQYLYRGLAARDFTKVFPLADHMEVNTGSIKNGVLTVQLKRIIPESLKPRKIKLIGE
jgi:molecular chaperone IbpA